MVKENESPVSETVISALRFNQNCAMIVADEQTSVRNKRYLLTEKLNAFSGNCSYMVFGGTGSSTYNIEVAEIMNAVCVKERKKIKTRSDLENTFAAAVREVKKNHVNKMQEWVSSEMSSWCEFDLPFEAFKEQKHSYLSDVSAKAFKFLKGINNKFLALCCDKNNIDLRVLSMNPLDCWITPWPYNCIGSGYEVVEREMHLLFEKLSREQRKRVPYGKGIVSILYGTHRACVRDSSVGGKPLIYLVNEGEIKMISEECSNVALHISKGIKNGLLSEEFSYKALTDLIFTEINPEIVYQKMWNKAKNKQALLNFLTGRKGLV